MESMREVREGMSVVDRSGKEVGTVEGFKEGDPEAVTSQGQAPRDDGGLVGEVADVLGAGTDLPAQHAERMMRVGYIKIDSKGLFKSDCFAAADHLDRVEDDVLHLSIENSELITG